MARGGLATLLLSRSRQVRKCQSGEVKIRAAEATHKGHRYGVDRWRGASNMYLIDTNSVSCFFAGDTALTPESTRMIDDHIAPAGRRLDMALLPIGYAPRWKRAGFRKGHLTTDDALTLFERLQARYLIPYHWGTFHHVTAKAHDAINELRTHLPAHARNADVRILEPGMSFELPDRRVTGSARSDSVPAGSIAGGQDTIAALATAPGRGAISVVRMSGRNAHRNRFARRTPVADRNTTRDTLPNHRWQQVTRAGPGTRHSLCRARFIYGRRSRGDIGAWRQLCTGRSSLDTHLVRRSTGGARRVQQASGPQWQARHRSGRSDWRHRRCAIERHAPDSVATARWRTFPPDRQASGKPDRSRSSDCVRHRLSRGRRRSDRARDV